MSDEELDEIHNDYEPCSRIDVVIADFRRMRDCIRGIAPQECRPDGFWQCIFCDATSVHDERNHAETCIWREVQDVR